MYPSYEDRALHLSCYRKIKRKKAFLSGKLKVEGDMRLAIRLQDLISLYNKQ
ncbi:SCP2 sterol-binding domain-containing protein [Virgibacillus sp. 19R1-5]|nr:SCP2 sterol-binding domain-containing protein [Virgibacillus sp. 19R1-5]